MTTTTHQSIAFINGKEVEYHGQAGPNIPVEQALKYYPAERYDYLGLGLNELRNKNSYHHFFKKKTQQ